MNRPQTAHDAAQQAKVYRLQAWNTYTEAKTITRRGTLVIKAKAASTSAGLAETMAKIAKQQAAAAAIGDQYRAQRSADAATFAARRARQAADRTAALLH